GSIRSAAASLTICVDRVQVACSWCSVALPGTSGLSCAPVLISGHLQVALRGAPLRIVVNERRLQQAHDRCVSGTEADVAPTSTTGAPFDAICKDGTGRTAGQSSRDRPLDVVLAAVPPRRGWFGGCRVKRR